MKKTQKGFTLVELIVVIAIIGILAAILVPSMMNYVKKAKLKSANSNAKLVYTTANSALADAIVEGKAVTSGAAFTGSATSVSGPESGEDGDDIVADAITAAMKDNGSSAGYIYAQLSGTSGVLFAQWSSNEDGTAGMIGQYPNPCNDVDAADNVQFSTYYSGSYSST